MGRQAAPDALTADETAALLIDAILDPDNRPLINALARGTLELAWGHGDEVTLHITTRVRRRLAPPARASH